MKIQKSVTVDGVELTYDELKSQMISDGINEKKFVDREPSNLPQSGTFTGFEKSGEGDFVHYRMTAKDVKDNDYKISLSRLQAYGLIKPSETAVCPIGAIRKSTAGNFYIGGESLNPEIPTDQAKAILALTGKKLTAVKKTHFALPFGVKYEDKETALENVGVTNVFKVTVVD